LEKQLAAADCGGKMECELRHIKFDALLDEAARLG
jgi:hypothetical protein